MLEKLLEIADKRDNVIYLGFMNGWDEKAREAYNTLYNNIQGGQKVQNYSRVQTNYEFNTKINDKVYLVKYMVDSGD
jgi:hypothetical protein